MSPELIQLALYAGSIALGWFLRHQGILAPASPPVGPVPLPGPVQPPAHPIASGLLAELDQFLSILAKLQGVGVIPAVPVAPLPPAAAKAAS